MRNQKLRNVRVDMIDLFLVCLGLTSLTLQVLIDTGIKRQFPKVYEEHFPKSVLKATHKENWRCLLFHLKPSYWGELSTRFKVMLRMNLLIYIVFSYVIFFVR